MGSTIDAVSTESALVEKEPEPSESARVRAIALLCSRLLEALDAGAPGSELGRLLDAAETLLSVDGVVLSLEDEQLCANGVPCPSASIDVLRATGTAHGIRRIVFMRSTSARELLQFLALLGDPPSEATGAIANLWRAHGAWRIRLELTGKTSSRLLEQRGDDPSASRTSDGDSPDVITAEQALATLQAACEQEAAGGAVAAASPFVEAATPERLRAVASLVGRGVSFAPDQPLGVVLHRAQADGTRALLALLADASNAVERHRYFDAIASLQHGVEDLIAALDHSTWYVVRNAAMLLGELRARTSDEAVGRLLGHADARVRLAAAQALPSIGTDAAFLALEAATRDPSMGVRVAAWSGLAVSPDTPSIACFSEALNHETDSVAQRSLLACLAEHPHPMAVALLVRFCARLVSNPHNGGIVCDTLELLAQHRPRSVAPFLRRLQDFDTPAMRSRIEALRSQLAA